MLDPDKLAALLPRKGVYETGRVRSSFVPGTPCESDTLQRETSGVPRGDDPVRRLQGKEGKPVPTSLQALHAQAGFQNLSAGFTGPVPVRKAGRGGEAMLRLVPQDASTGASEAAGEEQAPSLGRLREGSPRPTTRHGTLRLVWSGGRRVRERQVPEVLVTACGLLKEILRKAERDLARESR